ncbi:Histone-lysine N-methyltransferase SUVR4 [Euphorbia peplus]|nr:Histone-lysine N-methyltransferase SUVR4 [Euphorbia peplus]
MKEEFREGVNRALKKTRSVGLPDEKVKPMLRNLYILFGKNWGPIEADEYREFYNAYFDSEGAVADDLGDKTQIIAVKEEGQHGPTSKSHRIHQNINAMSHSGSSSNESQLSDDNVTIVSSTSKKVQVLLNCASTTGKSNFRKPDLNSVLKSLEDKYLRINKLVTPQFSVKKLLKDLCESYELRTLPSNTPVAENPLAVREVPNPRPQKRLCGHSNSETSNSENHRNMLMKTVAKVVDISKGAENVKIPLVDLKGKGDLPKFKYMTQNVIHQDAYLQVSLARISDEDCCSSCLGDCLATLIPCACARETGGEFAYTKDGLLKEEFLKSCMALRQNPLEHHFVFCNDCPLERSKDDFVQDKCKGHLIRKFIKECWMKCGCDMNCGNRVVQRGVRCSLQVFMTGEGKGWGVRTVEKLAKGSFICEYIGEILTNTELYYRNQQNSGSERHTYPVTLDADWGSEKLLEDNEALCLDATFCGNVARFINHRCNDGNLIDIPVEVETPDRHYYHLAFFTTREVEAMEELTWDYGIDFADKDHPIKAFTCFCGGAFCRDLQVKR